MYIPNNVQDARADIKSCTSLEIGKVYDRKLGQYVCNTITWASLSEEEKFERNKLKFNNAFSSASGGGMAFIDQNGNSREISLTNLEKIFAQGHFEKVNGSLILEGVFKFVKRGRSVYYELIESKI